MAYFKKELLNLPLRKRFQKGTTLESPEAARPTSVPTALCRPQPMGSHRSPPLPIHSGLPAGSQVPSSSLPRLAEL